MKLAWLNAVTFIYVLASVYGLVWIYDDFNLWRLYLYGYFALPLAVSFFSLALLAPHFWKKKRRLYGLCVGLLWASFAWGNLLLVNALTGKKTVTYGQVFKADLENRALTISYHKGGLGLPYQVRW